MKHLLARWRLIAALPPGWSIEVENPPGIAFLLDEAGQVMGKMEFSIEDGMARIHHDQIPDHLRSPEIINALEDAIGLVSSA